MDRSGTQGWTGRAPQLASLTSARAELLQCLSEYERPPHLHSNARFQQLFHQLTQAALDEGRLEEGLGFVRQEEQLREPQSDGDEYAINRAWGLYRLQQLLDWLGRHSEELVVCEQQLALAKKHLDDDEYVPQDIGVPSCIYQLAQAYSWVDRLAEREKLLQSALQLCEDYCRRHADAPVPAEVAQMLLHIRSERGD